MFQLVLNRRSKKQACAALSTAEAKNSTTGAGKYQLASYTCFDNTVNLATSAATMQLCKHKAKQVLINHIV